MKIKFMKSIAPTGKMKCTIHKNGKMGFSREAIKNLNISKEKHIKFGLNEEDRSDKNFYLLIQNYSDEETYKVNKAGDYYYLKTKNLFDKLNLDYERKKIIFDIQEIEINGITLYKLIRREIIRKKI